MVSNLTYTARLTVTFKKKYKKIKQGGMVIGKKALKKQKTAHLEPEKWT